MIIAAVTDRKNSIRPFDEQLELLASGRPDMIILREKDLTEGTYNPLAKECLEICDRYCVPLCINTFFRTALELGIHDVQMPMDLLKAHHMEFSGLHVGASIHSVADIECAQALGAERLVFGNVFETSCKPGKQPAGLALLEEVCISTDLPVWAIGGISESNVADVMKAGASGVCVMSSLMRANDPAQIVSSLRKNIPCLRN